MTLLEQTYTINARTVTINNNHSPAPTSAGPRVDRFEDMGPDERALYGLPLLGERLDGPTHREDCVGESLDVRVGRSSVDHAGPLDGGSSVSERAGVDHKNSPSVENPVLLPPRLYQPTVGAQTDARADSPTARRSNMRRQETPTPAVAPFYQDDLVTLYCGDALKLTDLWSHADVLITDPPYELQALAGAYGTSKRTIANDMDTLTRDAVLELWGDRPVAVFASPRMPEPPGDWSDRLVWDKGQLGLNGGPWRYAHENIFVRGEGWTRVDNRATSVMRHHTQANRKHVIDHIHSKPLPLLQQLVAAAPAGVLVDPFAGGGPTVAAAKLLGRRIIAIELEEGNCALIVERLRQQAFVIPMAPRHEHPQLPEV